MGRRLRAAPQPPWLHGEVARRMAERLAIVKLQPEQILDWWPQVGGGTAALAAASRRSRVQAVDSEFVAPAPAAWWSSRRWAPPPAPLREDAVPDATAQLVWANMMLHAVADPPAVMRQWQRALQVDGFLMFSTLGPGTLPQMRRIYAASGWGVPMGPLVDMHDLGDMLVQSGFADPVMDQEIVTLTWANAAEALAELRTLGSNVATQRHQGLRTPRWHRRLKQALETQAKQATSGRVALDFEIVYGHAFKPAPRARMGPESTVALDDMRAMVRAGHGRKRL
jgi:malonyl-CoA O-methyltransferase